MTLEVDLSVLGGKTGLVKEHIVTSDSETTRMRSIDEVIKLVGLLSSQSQSCTARTATMRAMFGFRGVPRNYVP